MKDFESDERMLSNTRNNPRQLFVRKFLLVPSKNFFLLNPHIEWHRCRAYVTNFHFFHRDPCHHFKFSRNGIFLVFIHGLSFYPLTEQNFFPEGLKFRVY